MKLEAEGVSVSFRKGDLSSLWLIFFSVPYSWLRAPGFYYSYQFSPVTPVYIHTICDSTLVQSLTSVSFNVMDVVCVDSRVIFQQNQRECERYDYSSVWSLDGTTRANIITRINDGHRLRQLALVTHLHDKIDLAVIRSPCSISLPRSWPSYVLPSSTKDSPLLPVRRLPPRDLSLSPCPSTRPSFSQLVLAHVGLVDESCPMPLLTQARMFFSYSVQIETNILEIDQHWGSLGPVDRNRWQDSMDLPIFCGLSHFFP